MARRISTPAGPAINLGRMGPIQLIPPGLMGLLQLKQTGRLPGTLNDIVSGVLELREWYMMARRVNTLALFPGASFPVINGITAPGVGVGFVPAGGGNATVPNGQIWWVDNMTIQCTISAAASSIRYSPAINRPGVVGGDVIQVGYQDVADVVNAHANRKIIVHNDRPFWAFPGDGFAANIHDVTTGTAEALTLTLSATPMLL